MKKVIAFLLSSMLLLTFVVTALADVYSDAGFIKKIPMKAKFTETCDQNGTVVKLNYTTHAYALEAMATGDYTYCLELEEGDVPQLAPEGVLPPSGTDILVEKELYVYLPYGYTSEKEYNVIYLMHGGGEDAAYWLTDERMGKGTRSVLDNMVKRGECADTIVVTPTFYSVPDGEAYESFYGPFRLWPCYFWMELKNDIIPLVESTYSTYAHGDISVESLIATRDHRAYAGFSMGSVTSLNSVMMHCLDVISWVGSFSGSLTRFDEFKAALKSDEFINYPIHFWYNGSGSNDFQHDEHQEFYQKALAELPERFTDGETSCWVEFKGGTHAYNCWLPHLYNCMKIFFK